MGGDVVGRRRELERVDVLLDAAVGGRGECVLFSGPAGIGKSHLAREVARRGRAREISVHRARGWEGPGVPALWPWSQVVRSVVADGLDLSWVPSGDALRRLLAADADPWDGAFAVLDGLARLVEEAARERPVLLVFDDLHSSDLSSLDALRFVMREVGEAPVALVATSRPVFDIGSDVGDGLLRIARDSEVVELAGLDLSDLSTLIERRGYALSPATVLAIHEATGGNPFFALELARLADGPDSAGDHLRLPRTVRAAVLEQLQDLDAGARAGLDAAAVQGREVDLAVLAHTAGITAIELERCVAVAERVGILEATEAGARFVHALIVEVLVDELGIERRRLLRIAVADAIERLHGPTERAEVVASHLFAAPDLVAADRLEATGRAAATRALRRGAPADAARHLGETVRALRGRDDPSPTAVIDLLVDQARLAGRAGRIDDGVQAAVEAADLARGLGDWSRLARAALAVPPDLEVVEVEELERTEQLELREEAMSRVPRDDPLLVARLMSALALSLYWAPLLGERARDHGASAGRRDQLTAAALVLAREAEDDGAIVECLAARIQALWGPDSPADRGALVDELVARAEQIGAVDIAMRGRIWRVVDLLESGRVHEADREIDGFARRAEAIRHPHFRWVAARWRATRAIMGGRLADAETACHDALALGTPAVGEEAAFSFFATTLGLIRYLQGRLAETEPILRELTALYPHIPAWHAGLAAVGAETGDLGFARSELEWLAAGDFQVLPRDLYWLSGLAVLAPAILACGHARIARLVRELLAPASGRLVLQGNGYSVYGPVDRVLGMCAAAMGDLPGALDLLEQAVAQSAEPIDPFRALSRYELGRVLLAMGDDENGREVLAEAARELRAAGMDEFATRAEAPPPVALDDAGRGVFRLEGDHWLVRRPDGPPVRVPDRRGIAMLHALVQLREVPAMDLAGVVEHDGDAGALARHALAVEHHDPFLDAAARRAYRARLGAIEEELDAADGAGDAERSRRLVEERGAIADEMARATGLGGRARRDAGAAERARVNVTKHLRRAIAELEARDSGLGDHFARAVRTGSVCSYVPDRDEVIRWSVG